MRANYGFGVINCTICTRRFIKKTGNQLTCGTVCSMSRKAYWDSLRVREVPKYEGTFKESQLKWRENNKTTIRANQRKNYLKNRENGALYRMYGKCAVTDKQRIACAMKRVNRYPDHFTRLNILYITQGHTKYAYQRVRAMSKIQIKTTKGDWPD